MDWRAPIVVASLRALAGGLVAAGVAGFTAAVQGASLKSSAIIAGAAFFSYLATRGLAEGSFDQSKAA